MLWRSWSSVALATWAGCNRTLCVSRAGKALGDVSLGLEALSQGARPRLIRTTMRGPIGRLVRTFNEAATDVVAQTARLDQDRQQLLVVLGCDGRSRARGR